MAAESFPASDRGCARILFRFPLGVDFSVVAQHAYRLGQSYAGKLAIDTAALVTDGHSDEHAWTFGDSIQHLGLWEESQAPPDTGAVKREITFDHSYTQLI